MSSCGVLCGPATVVLLMLWWRLPGALCCDELDVGDRPLGGLGRGPVRPSGFDVIVIPIEVNRAAQLKAAHGVDHPGGLPFRRPVVRAWERRQFDVKPFLFFVAILARFLRATGLIWWATIINTDHTPRTIRRIECRTPQLRHRGHIDADRETREIDRVAELFR